jgi:hypothetical protein
LFNIVEDHADPNQLHRYEVYTSEQAFERHKQTPAFPNLAGDYQSLAGCAPGYCHRETPFPCRRGLAETRLIFST